jgi:HEAT repeat protein
MSEQHFQDDPRLRGTFSAEDALPPVEPPSAGFILKLFVIPGLIVTIIVLVWLLFNWLAQMGNDPRHYVKAISRNNEGRWQAAVNLANALNNERGEDFKQLRQDRETVRELAAVLEAEIDDNRLETQLGEKPVTFRMFLCRALGSFEVPEGLPALLKAVNTNRDPRERDVRRSALEGIALLADNVRQADPAHPLESKELTATLLSAASDSDPLIRSSAAYAMGVVGGEQLNAKLRILLEDANPDVRFNAATGLARLGDPLAAGVLMDMLDPAETAGVEVEKEEQSRTFKRALIQFNGLRAVEALVGANPKVDRSQFVPVVEKLLASKPPKNVEMEARKVLRLVNGQSE